MGYWFQGLFVAVTDKATINAVCHEILTIWPQAFCRHILGPFHGVGVSRTADAFQSHVELARLDEEPQGWTPRFPELTSCVLKRRVSEEPVTMKVLCVVRRG